MKSLARKCLESLRSRKRSRFMESRKSPAEIWKQAVLEMCADDGGKPEWFAPVNRRAIACVARMVRDGYDDDTDYTGYGSPGLGDIFNSEDSEARGILKRFDGGMELYDLLLKLENDEL